MRLSLKIAAILLIVLSFGVGLTAYLSQAKFENTLENLVRSRLEVVAVDLKNTVEGALGIGLSLEEARNIPAALEQALRADSEILSIRVLSSDGQQVFAADRDGANAEGLIVRTSFQNAYGQPAGTIVVHGSRDAVDAVSQDTLRRITVVSLSAIGTAVLFGALAAFLMLRRILGLFSGARDGLAAMLKGWTPPVEPPDDDAPPLEKDFREFQGHARAAFIALHSAEQGKPDA